VEVLEAPEGSTGSWTILGGGVPASSQKLYVMLKLSFTAAELQVDAVNTVGM
jgi:hypothetical protein